MLPLEKVLAATWHSAEHNSTRSLQRPDYMIETYMAMGELYKDIQILVQVNKLVSCSHLSLDCVFEPFQRDTTKGTVCCSGGPWAHQMNRVVAALWPVGATHVSA